jgi:hypothetical protein
VAASGNAARPALATGANLPPLACLVAIAVCAFTAAGTTGSPRSAVGQGGPARRTWPGPCSVKSGHRPVHHHVHGVTFREDTCASRSDNGPADLATIRATIKDAGYLHVKAAATTAPRRNPLSPRPRLGRERTFTEHAGALSTTPKLFMIPHQRVLEAIGVARG